MSGLLIVGIVIVALVLYGADRAIKARAQARRLRTMSDRLAAATTRAEEQEEHRQADADAGAALTSVIHAIERPPLTLPGMTSPPETPDPSAPAPPETPDPAAAAPPETPDPAAAAPPETPDPAAESGPATSHGTARPRAGREHTGPQERRPGHPGRPPAHLSNHVGTVRVGPDGEDHDEGRDTRPIGAATDPE